MDIRGPHANDEVHRWAVILAGGDGKGKQIRAIPGVGALLDQTLRRVERVVNPRHTLVVVTKARERFY